MSLSRFVHLHLQNLTQVPKIAIFERRYLFQTIVFVIDVKFLQLEEFGARFTSLQKGSPHFDLQKKLWVLEEKSFQKDLPYKLVNYFTNGADVECFHSACDVFWETTQKRRNHEKLVVQMWSKTKPPPGRPQNQQKILKKHSSCKEKKKISKFKQKTPGPAFPLEIFQTICLH